MVELWEALLECELTLNQLYMLYAIREQGKLVTVTDMEKVFPLRSTRWVKQQIADLKEKNYLKMRAHRFYCLSKKATMFCNRFEEEVKIYVNIR